MQRVNQMPDNEITLVTKLRDGITGKLDKQGAAFQRWSKRIKVAGVAAVAALSAIGLAAIKAAMNAEEIQSKFETVFKELAGSVQAELDNMASSLGRNKYDLRAWASTLQDTFVPLGFAREQAAAMSVEVVQLALDLASFNNLPTEQVIMSIQSALVGNVETLRQFGVAINQDVIEQEAMNTALWDGVGAIDAQAKAAAIMQLIIAGTADAQGDLARTSGSAANQWRAFKAVIDESLVDLGKELLPAFTKLLPDAQKALQDLAKIGIEVVPFFIASVQAGINVAGQFVDAIKTFAEANKIMASLVLVIKQVGQGWDNLVHSLEGYTEQNEMMLSSNEQLAETLAKASREVISNAQAFGTLAQQIDAANKAAGGNAEAITENMMVLGRWTLGITQAAVEQERLAGELVLTRDQVIAQAQSFIDSVPAITAFAGAINTILGAETDEPTISPVDSLLGTDEEMETKKEHWKELLDEIAAIIEEKEEHRREMEKEAFEEMRRLEAELQETIAEAEREELETRLAAIAAERAARTAALQNAISQARSFGYNLVRAGLSGENAIDRWFDNFKSRLLDIVSMAAFNTVLNFLGGGGGGIFGGIAGLFGFQGGTGKGGIPHAQGGLEIQGTGILGDRHLVMAETGEVITPRQKVIQDRYLQQPQTTGAVAVTVNSFLATGSQAEMAESGRILREILDREGITFNG